MGDVAVVAGVAARCAIALVLVVSVASKLRGQRELRAFRESIGALVPGLAGWSGGVAAVVVGLEAAIPAALVHPRSAGAGLVVAAGLLGCFTVAIAAARARGERRPCRCFGASSTALGRRHLVRNAALVLTCAAGLPGTIAGHGAGAAATALAVGIGVTVALTIILFDDLAELAGNAAVH
jgi:hypothetical protein